MENIYLEACIMYMKDGQFGPSKPNIESDPAAPPPLSHFLHPTSNINYSHKVSYYIILKAIFYKLE